MLAGAAGSRTQPVVLDAEEVVIRVGALSMHYALIAPPKGGETEFADLRRLRRAAGGDQGAGRAAGGRAFHLDLARLARLHRLHGRGARTGPARAAARGAAASRLAPQALYLAAHASHILGWEVPEGRRRLRELIEHATQPEFTHLHHWKAGNLVVWDNGCTMHRGRSYDPSETRDLRRVTTRGIASTLDQAVA